MSLVRITFWEVVARGYGGSAWPKKYGMNWFIPAFVSSRPDSGGGISDEDRTRVCPRSSKNDRNSSRIRLPSTGDESTGGSGGARPRDPVLRAKLPLPIVRRSFAFLHGLGHELREIEEPAAGLARDRGRLG